MSAILAIVLAIGAGQPATRPDAESSGFGLLTIDGRSILADAIRTDPQQRITFESPREEGVDVGTAAAWPAVLDDLAQITVLSERSAGPTTGSSPAATAIVTLHLAGGGRVQGAIRSRQGGLAGTGPSVTVDVGLARPLDIPLSSLAAVQFSQNLSEAASSALAARLNHRDKTQDVLLIDSPEGIVSFSGALERLDSAGWTFKIGERTQRGDFTRAAAVVLASGLTKLVRFGATLHRHDGGEWPGRIESADERGVRFAVAGGPPVEVPWPQVRAISLNSSQVLFLSDVEPVEATSEGFFGSPWPWRRNRTTSGGPLQIGGKPFAKGLGVHSRSRLVFAVPPEFVRFAATIGIDDETKGRGEVVFRALAGEKRLFESDPVRGGERPREINVELRGADRITLEVDFAGGLDIGDHADWANARLLKK